MPIFVELIIEDRSRVIIFVQCIAFELALPYTIAEVTVDKCWMTSTGQQNELYRLVYVLVYLLLRCMLYMFYMVVISKIQRIPIFRTIRYVMVSICLFFLVFFWSVPVVIVSSMVSLDALQKKFSFLEGGNHAHFLFMFLDVNESVFSLYELVFRKVCTNQIESGYCKRKLQGKFLWTADTI